MSLPANNAKCSWENESGVLPDITLCAPDKEKSCFGCCPPIRPPNYEHIQYRNIVKRMLRENTRMFEFCSRHQRPITGFSCWALGYLDDTFKIIGCLLHPARHDGVDLRYRTGYGEKCRRESCPESGVFLKLSKEARRFFLGLTLGFDSFEYSSRKHNPLFTLLGWGEEILEQVYQDSNSQSTDRESFSSHYPVLVNTAHPRACAYLLRYVMERLGPRILKSKSFSSLFQGFSEDLFETFSTFGPGNGSLFTHRLAMDKAFEDMLRLGIGIKKIERETACKLKEEVDRRLELFLRTIA